MDLTLAHVLLVVLLIGAAFVDLQKRRVPNLLVLVGGLLGFMLMFTPWAVITPKESLLGALVGLLFFMLPYVFGKIGAGDVKLFAMLGIYLGPALTLMAGLYTMLAGGLLALLFLLQRRFALKTATFVTRSEDLPYAVAILFGVLAALSGL